MKTWKIFCKDLKNNMKSFISLWIIIIPIVLAFVINVAAPGTNDSYLSVAMLKSTPEHRTGFYETYASLVLLDSEAQVEKRVMAGDYCFGILPDNSGNYFIVSQGNEPKTVTDGIKLLKTYEEKGIQPSGEVTFTDFGRTAPPLKSILMTGLLILITIMSGMLISLGLVEEKSDRTIRAVKVAPVPMTSFVFGKSLIGVAYTLISGFIVLLVGGYLSGNGIQVLVLLLASSLISLIIGFLIGLMSDDFISAAGNVKLIMIPALAPILVTELAPEKWHCLVWWSPFFWSYDAIKGLLNRTAEAGRVFMDCGIVLAIGTILYILLLPHIRKRLN